MRGHTDLLFSQLYKNTRQKKETVQKSQVQVKRINNLLDEEEGKKNIPQEYLIYEESLCLTFQILASMKQKPGHEVLTHCLLLAIHNSIFKHDGIIDLIIA